MRRTKIVATIGPASREPEVLKRMVEAGLDVARLNFSHGNLELHAENAERVREAANAAGRQVAILQDLPGPKLRVGAIENEIADRILSASRLASTIARPEFDTQACATPSAASARTASNAPGIGESDGARAI